MIIQFVNGQNNVWTLIEAGLIFCRVSSTTYLFFSSMWHVRPYFLTRDQTWTPAVIESSWLDCQGNPRLVSAEPLLIQEK